MVVLTHNVFAKTCLRHIKNETNIYIYNWLPQTVKQISSNSFSKNTHQLYTTNPSLDLQLLSIRSVPKNTLPSCDNNFVKS